MRNDPDDAEQGVGIISVWMHGRTLAEAHGVLSIGR